MRLQLASAIRGGKVKTVQFRIVQGSVLSTETALMEYANVKKHGLGKTALKPYVKIIVMEMERVKMVEYVNANHFKAV